MTKSRVITNWWTKDTDDMDPEVIRRLDENARRRIDTRRAKGETIGNEYDKANGIQYECLWRVVKVKKPKKKNNGSRTS